MLNEEGQEIVLELMQYFPKTIRDELMRDSEFRSRNKMRSVGTINFPDVSVPFSRNETLDAVGRVFREESTPEKVLDKTGAEWEVRWDSGRGYPIMVKGELEIPLQGLWFVAIDDTTRRAMLDRMFSENRAVGPEFDHWRAVLADAPVDYDDIERLHEDMESTPTQNVIRIRSGLENGSSHPDTLVPRGLAYYERLVGSAADADTVTAFAAGPAKAHATELLQWNADAGLKQALLSGAQAALVPSLPEDFDREALERVIKWAAAYGDRISQLSAFELGLRYLEECPALAIELVSIAEQIRDDDPADPEGRLLLLSNLFVFVDGGIAHGGDLRDVPPFWRRLASLAQASVIEREFIVGGLRAGDTESWVNVGRGSPFYLQNSIDGRKEPRWLPDFANPHQWKRELVSRIIGAAERNPAAIYGTPLEPILKSREQGSLLAQFEFPFSYLPGPLEGGLDLMVDAPAEIQEAVRESLSVSPLEQTAFNALVNTCLVFRTPVELAQQAAEVIKNAKYRIRENVESGQHFAMLSGLATVASVTRSRDLAREVRVLTRIALLRGDDNIDPVQSFRICLISANGFEDIQEWRAFLGEWVTELAFGDLEKTEALHLHGMIEALCALEPALWATLSRAEAALSSFINVKAPGQ